MKNEVFPRYLVVNADDFGLSPGVNRGIIKSHEDGIVTSASLMVRWPAAAEAAAYAREHPELSVGLHLDLCEWKFVNETWQPLYEVVPTDNTSAVADEVARQLDTFRRLMGLDPTHLDSHQHVHRTEPVLSIMLGEARKLGVVLRGYGPGVRYCREFYGQSGRGSPYPKGISVGGLLEILTNLPPGTTELGCHPGLGDDVESVYRNERALECETLCDPQIRSAIVAQSIVLCSFSNWRNCGTLSRTQ
jgi:predicted glycoside hydrolase/deacetylase ChbG (UPF0249 family)